MKELKFDLLTKDEIEVRIGNGSLEKGISLLLYKTARVDANALDKTVGAMNWQKKFYQVKNTMICSIGIYDEDKNCWVWKDDGGDDDFQTEQVKAECSDAMKRAGFQWGIGRELYTSPFIFINKDLINKYSITKYTKFKVKEIEYDIEKRTIKIIVISDDKGNTLFNNKSVLKPTKNENKPQLDTEREQLIAECKELGMDMIRVAAYFKVQPNEITNDILKQAIEMKKKARKQ